MAPRDDEERLESLQAAVEQDALERADKDMLEFGSPARVRGVFAKSLRAAGYDAAGGRLLPSRRRRPETRGGHVSYDRQQRDAPIRATFGPPQDAWDDDEGAPDTPPRAR